MSEKIPGIAELCLSLKSDLAQIVSLSYNDRKNHLEHISKQLLKSTYKVLSQEKISVTSTQSSQLGGYFLEYLSFNNSISVDSLMCLFRLKSLNSNLNSLLENEIDNLIDISNSKSDIFKIIKILEQLFMFDSNLASAIFTRKTSFINALTNEITLLSNDINKLNSETTKNLNTILVLFSNACVEETSRSMIASMYINLILKCLLMPKISQSKCYASTIAIKSWRMIKPETLSHNAELLSLDNLSKIIIDSLHENFKTSVEGLSLLCTNIQIKNKVRNEKVLTTLLALINHKEHTYGIILILTLITLPNRTLAYQQRSISSLKDSNSISNIDIFTNIPNKKEKDDLTKIQYVIHELIKKNLITEKLVPIFKSIESSKGLIGQSIKLMYNIVFPDIDVSNSSNTLSDLYILQIKQIIKLLTAYLIGNSQSIKYNQKNFISYTDDKQELSDQDLEIRSIAIKSLCSPEISSNIEKIYSNNDEEFALSPIPFILEIIVQHDIDTGISVETKHTPFSSIKKQIFSNFDVYYAFVSLAAITSLSYSKSKQYIFTLGFDSIINSLTSSDDKIQFSSLQLLNELSDMPLCIAKFFNWEKTTDNYYQNFTVLCHLLQSNNYDSQCLVVQIFYNVSRYEIVIEKLCQSELFCSNLDKIFQNQDSEDALIYYALLLLSQIIPFKNSSDNMKIFEHSKNIIAAHTKSKNEQIKTVSNLIIKYL